MLAETEVMESLKRVFADVTQDKRGVIVAKGWIRPADRTTCKHLTRVTQRNVSCYISKDGFLATGGEPMFHKRIVSCIKCERVLEVE